MDDEKRSEADTLAAPKLDSTNTKDFLTLENVRSCLEKCNAESFLTNTSYAFLKEVGQSVFSDYLKLQKNLLPVGPSTPKQLVTCTFMQKELNLLPEEWNGLKIQNRKGKLKGVWTLLSNAIEGTKDKQWYMHNLRTHESRYIPSLEQVFAMLHLHHPKNRMPLYKIALREVYSMLHEDTCWVMPAKRLVFLSMRHIRSVKGMGRKEEKKANEILPLQRNSHPNFQSLANRCHKQEYNKQDNHMVETSSRGWKVALEKEWKTQNVKKALEPLSSRLKLVARILSESNHTLICKPPPGTSRLVHEALVNQYGLVPLDIMRRNEDSQALRIKAPHQFWLSIMLKEEPSNLPPPVDIINTLWDKLLDEVENEGADSSIVENYKLCVQKIDLGSLCQICCQWYSVSLPDPRDRGTEDNSQTKDPELVAPCLFNARQDACNYLHWRKRQRQEETELNYTSSSSTLGPHPLSLMFVPFLVKEPVAVVIPMAKVHQGEGTIWSTIRTQDTLISAHVSFLWQTFEEKGGLIYSTFQDEPWSMCEAGVKLPRLMFLWDGLGNILPVVGQDIFKKLEEVSGTIETSKTNINRK